MPPSLIVKVRVLIFGKAIYFDSSLVVAGAFKGKRCFNAKKVKAYAILYALRRAIDFG